jgi:hypothetical protein
MSRPAVGSIAGAWAGGGHPLAITSRRATHADDHEVSTGEDDHGFGSLAGKDFSPGKERTRHMPGVEVVAVIVSSGAAVLAVAGSLVTPLCP